MSLGRKPEVEEQTYPSLGRKPEVEEFEKTEDAKLGPPPAYAGGSDRQ